jgi:hypothetical protein
VIGLKVLAIVRELEDAINHASSCFGGACVIGILEQFRENMPWTLNLLEQLMPWPC